MAATRQRILYDVIPWRRHRVKVGLVALAFIAADAAGQPLLHHDGWLAVTLFALMVVAIGTFIGMGLWAQFSSVSVDTDGLRVRMGFRVRRTLSVPAEMIRSVRVARLGDVFTGAQRDRIPRPLSVWSTREAVAYRVDTADLDAESLEYYVGRRSVCRDEVVVPVADAQRLLAESVRCFGDRVIPPARRTSGRNPRRRRS